MNNSNDQDQIIINNNELPIIDYNKIVTLPKDFNNYLDNKYFRVLIGSFRAFAEQSTNYAEILQSMHNRKVLLEWVEKYYLYCAGELI